MARTRSDQSLAAIADVWPPTAGGTAGAGDPAAERLMFRSPHLFAAILHSHRVAVKVGDHFRDEVQFYTDVIDAMLGWLNRELGGGGSGDIRLPDHLWGLLHSYGYLMGAVGYVGAEQALCTVFHSVVCFSHKETFYYANFSFSAEALFRLYRQSYPTLSVSLTAAAQTGDESVAATVGDRTDGWRTADHRTFFPELDACRQEIIADMDYIGMSTDPSLCAYSRKNETRFHEVDALAVVEAGRLADEIVGELAAVVAAARRRAAVSAAVFAAVAGYVVAAHVVRCVGVRVGNVRSAKRRDRTAKQLQQQVVAASAGPATAASAAGGGSSFHDHIHLDHQYHHDHQHHHHPHLNHNRQLPPQQLSPLQQRQRQQQQQHEYGILRCENPMTQVDDATSALQQQQQRIHSCNNSDNNSMIMMMMSSTTTTANDLQNSNHKLATNFPALKVASV